MDKIIIRDLLAHGLLGVYEYEREQTQEILINLILYTNTQPAAQSDNISDCLNYHTLANNVKTLAESAQRFTIEALTNDIANLCLAEKRVQKVRVRVEKPEAISFLSTIGVEIERQR